MAAWKGWERGTGRSLELRVLAGLRRLAHLPPCEEGGRAAGKTWAACSWCTRPSRHGLPCRHWSLAPSLSTPCAPSCPLPSCSSSGSPSCMLVVCDPCRVLVHRHLKQKRMSGLCRPFLAAAPGRGGLAAVHACLCPKKGKRRK